MGGTESTSPGGPREPTPLPNPKPNPLNLNIYLLKDQL